ncbi:MAG TPA: hypothetical protein VMS76_04420 [Planctomycetota bacterium]|nr:hypothetical protein [Planctomycetota bacterium]
MSVLNRTPLEVMLDPQGRPYCLWDVDMTLARFQELLREGDADVRAYLIGKLMRQAKPDDDFTFVSLREIHEAWLRLERYLGRTREFWRWLLATWQEQGVAKPTHAGLGRARFQVDTPHEILVNKLCTLLDRAEIREIQDIRELLAQGGDLDRALSDAPRKNSGFSPLTMAGLLRDLRLASMAEASGLGEAELKALDRFREELLARVARSAAPEPES